MPFAPEPTPSGRWRGGFKHPVTGRKIRKTFDYQYEAESWAIVEEQKAKNQAAGAPDQDQQPAVAPPIWTGQTLTQYGQEYLERRAGLLASETLKKYRSWITGLDIPVGKTGRIGERPMGLLKRSEVQQWMTDQVHAGVGAPTVNGRLGMVRRLYQDLMADGDAPIQRDPTFGLDGIPEDESDDHIVSLDEEAELLAAAQLVGGTPLAAAVLTGLDAGLRWQEVYGLRAASLFNEADYLLVTHVVERDRKTLRPYTKGRKKSDGHRKRSVPTTDRLRAALQQLAHGKDPDELLFPSPSGGIFDYHNHRNRFWSQALYEIGAAERVERPTNRIRKTGPDAGKPYLRTRYEPAWGFHSLRHTYGSRLAAAGVPRSEIKVLMGHSDERTTARYIHAGDDGRRLSLVRDVLGQKAA